MAGCGHRYGGSSNGNASDWSRTNYLSDHVCRPVIIDAEGRKKPIVSFTFPHNTEGRTERVSENMWHKPQGVDQGFITNEQNEGSSKHRYGALSSVFQHRSSSTSTGFNGNTGGYGKQDDSRVPMEPTMITNGGWTRPSRKMWATPPGTTPTGMFGKPSAFYSAQSQYAEPDAWSGNSLSKPTSDIGGGYTKPSALYGPRPQYAEPAYTETIDSREAERRYGRFNFSSRPVQTDYNYAKRY